MNRSRYSRGEWLEIDGHGLVAVGRIVAVGLAEAASMKRLVGAWPVEKVLDLTGRQKRQAVLILDSGHVVLVPVTIEVITEMLLEELDEQGDDIC
jgi:regulator of extracellular matrix RemA (YlzA/DUF370 family)